VTWRPAWLPCA